nr:glycosyltransferase family 4 protein [Ectothiorhodospira haloalkaliphila]
MSGQLGGLELRLRQEALMLKGLDVDSVIALNPFPDLDSLIDKLKDDNIPFVNFSPPPFFEQWKWRRLNKLRAKLIPERALAMGRIDLMHVAMAWTDTAGTRLWLAHQYGIPAVISVHNTFPSRSFTAWETKILTKGFRAVKGIYAVSESALENFLTLFAPFITRGTEISVIPNPVNTKLFKPSNTARRQLINELNIPPESTLIGSACRLDKQKQPELLIKIFSKLRNRHPDLHLLFIGQGQLRDTCEALTRDLGLTDRVHFLGFRSDVHKLIAGLDLHILLSTLEGFGIATAEAMACGVPVVATDVPGSRDILRASEAGILVPKTDETTICALVSELLADAKKREAMGNQGPLEVRTRYSLHTVEKQIHDFYSRALPLAPTKLVTTR